MSRVPAGSANLLDCVYLHYKFIVTVGIVHCVCILCCCRPFCSFFPPCPPLHLLVRFIQW